MKSFNNLKKWQKITCIAALAAVVVGSAGVTTFLLLNQKEDTTTPATVSVSTTDSSAIALTLQEGKNKISSGGTYHVTGSINEGYIVIDTSDDVKLILDNVTIKTSDNQSIHSKQQNNVVIELINENTIETSIPESEDTKPAISVEGSVGIEGSGALNISSTGKGIKAIDTITINSGIINIEKSYEGLEANIIEINGGETSIVASDDGINGTDNSDNPSTTGQIAMGGEATTNSLIEITDGKLYINASGDGIDSNGSIVISGGTTYVDGPTNDGNGALDYNGSMTITGGTLIAVGSSGMAMNASSAEQASVLINLSSTYNGKINFGGIEYTPSKSYSSVLVSSPALKVGETYTLSIDNSEVQSVTISDTITGSGSGMMMGGMMGEAQGQGDMPRH